MTRHTELHCDAVLFDLDGVLVDSTRCVERQWQRWADRHNLDFHQIMQVSHGRQSIDTMRLIAPHLDAVQEAAQFADQEVLDTDGIVAIEGASRILAALPESSWGIVTSGKLALARVRLEKARLPIPPILVTAEAVRQGKPSPECYRIGAQRLGVSAERCVVIEDSPAGVEAGKMAGMRVIGVLTTHAKATLLDQEADFVIERLNQLEIRANAQGGGLMIGWD